MKTPYFAKALASLKGSQAAKKLRMVNAFYAKHPNKGIHEVKDDGPVRKPADAKK